ncbi:MAG TPA: glycosyltransferase [Ignavibacteria bacterium]|nr:glycosyltransferase [Ignavibacteria bacterium]
MKRVLFLSYYFPPLATGGVFRSLNFVKYLQEFGWFTTVLTVKNPQSWSRDESLLDQIPENVKVIRAKEFNLLFLHVLFSKIGLEKLYDLIEKKWVIPDKKVGWLPLALLKGKKELKTSKYDIIFSTSPSVCAHIIGQKLSQQFNIPWVCEFRDLWTLQPHYPFQGKNREKKESAIEKEFLTNAKKIVVVTKTFKNEYLQKYSFLPSDKIEVIYNGFKQLTPLGYTKSNKLVVAYTGSMYGQYYPIQLYDALDELGKINPEMNFHFLFIGNAEKQIVDKLSSYSAVSTEFIPFQSKKDLPKILEGAAALLVFQLGKYSSVPSKVFEYLSYQKPILALVPEDELREIVMLTGMGYCANPNDIDDIQKILKKLYNDWQQENLPKPKNIKVLDTFKRYNQTQQLAKLFDSIV